MAVAVQEAATSVDMVTEAALDMYRAHLDEANEMALAEFIDAPKVVGSMRAVVAPGDRAVEVVLDADSPADDLTEVAWVLNDRSWSLNVLVELSRLGDAHTALRGTPATLQGWWVADDAVHFAGYERP